MKFVSFASKAPIPSRCHAWSRSVTDTSRACVSGSQPREVIQARLVCQRKITQRSGKSTSTTTENIWEHTQTLSASEARREMTGVALPLRAADTARHGKTTTALDRYIERLDHFKTIQQQITSTAMH